MLKISGLPNPDFVRTCFTISLSINLQSYGSGFIEAGYGNGSGSNISRETGSGSGSRGLMTKN
jgi:hypothetical protein